MMKAGWMDPEGLGEVEMARNYGAVMVWMSIAFVLAYGCFWLALLL